MKVPAIDNYYPPSCFSLINAYFGSLVFYPTASRLRFSDINYTCLIEATILKCDL